MSSAPRHLLTAGILATSTLLEAQQPERAVFLVRLGRDTIAVENASILNGRFEGDLRYRTPLVRVRRTITVSPLAELQMLDITVGSGPRGDSAQVHSTFTVSGIVVVPSVIDLLRIIALGDLRRRLGLRCHLG